MKNPTYSITKKHLLESLRSEEVLLALAKNDMNQVAEIIIKNNIGSNITNPMVLKVNGRTFNATKSVMQHLLNGNGLSVEQLENTHKLLLDFWWKTYRISKFRIAKVSFNPKEYKFNKDYINSLIRFEQKIDYFYSDVSELLSKKEFVTRFFKYCAPYTIKPTKKINPDCFTEETFRQTYTLIVASVENEQYPERDMVVHMISKFIGHTKYNSNKLDLYLTNPTYFDKFRNGYEIVKENVVDPITQKSFTEMSSTKQKAYIQLWIQYNLDFYLKLNNLKNFKIIEEPIQIGYIAGQNPTSRENALKRFEDKMEDLIKANKHKLKQPRKVEKDNKIKLRKKLTDW